MSRRTHSRLINKLYVKLASLSDGQVLITRSRLGRRFAVNRGDLRLMMPAGGVAALTVLRERLLADLRAEGWQRDSRSNSMVLTKEHGDAYHVSILVEEVNKRVAFLDVTSAVHTRTRVNQAHNGLHKEATA